MYLQQVLGQILPVNGHRPHRKRHAGDRPLGSGITPQELAIDSALAPFDRAMRQTEARWVCNNSVERAKIPATRRWGKDLIALNSAASAAHKGCLQNLGAAKIRLTLAAHRVSWSLDFSIEKMIMQPGIGFALQRVEPAFPK